MKETYKRPVLQRRMSSILVNTRTGVKTYTIKPESPRTQQALIELGIDNTNYYSQYFEFLYPHHDLYYFDLKRRIFIIPFNTVKFEWINNKNR